MLGGAPVGIRACGFVEGGPEGIGTEGRFGVAPNSASPSVEEEPQGAPEPTAREAPVPTGARPGGCNPGGNEVGAGCGDREGPAARTAGSS